MSKRRKSKKRKKPRGYYKSAKRRNNRTNRILNLNGLERKRSRIRKNSAIYKALRTKILAHPYWKRPLLGDAVVAWVDYKIETTLGMYAEQKFDFYMQNDSPSRLSQGKRHLTSIEVKRIADNICGYTTGDEMFPAHLTHEEAIDHIEICEMIREYWASAVYTYVEAEERYFIIRKYKMTHPNAKRTVVKDIALPNSEFWKCTKHYGALDGKKGELIHNWYSLCGKPGTAARGYLCVFCQQLQILMTTNKTERFRYYERERDTAVTSFQITRLLLSRFEAIQDDENPLDLSHDSCIIFSKIIQDCVARQTIKRKGKLSLNLEATSVLMKTSIMKSGSVMGKNTMNEELLKKYAPLYDSIAYVLSDQDLTITLPDLCDCPSAACDGFDFLSAWLTL
jgi:hypothetical protein